MSKTKPRLFTVEAANRTLPLVSAIVADLAPLWRHVNGMRDRIHRLLENREVQDDTPYGDELKAMRETLECDARLVENYLDELRQLGVEFKGDDGHVGFPAMLEGRLVYLSWSLGEPEVSYWIELDAEFEDRRSLLAGPITQANDSLVF